MPLRRHWLCRLLPEEQDRTEHRVISQTFMKIAGGFSRISTVVIAVLTLTVIGLSAARAQTPPQRLARQWIDALQNANSQAEDGAINFAKGRRRQIAGSMDQLFRIGWPST